jgi:hypothetical protein
MIGSQFMIDKPDPVSRVYPPIPTITQIIKQTVNNQAATNRFPAVTSAGAAARPVLAKATSDAIKTSF